MTDSPADAGSLPADGPLTREAVQGEVARIMRDPGHPQHHGYSRGMPAAHDFIQGLYARVVGASDPVDLDGLTIGGPAATSPSMPAGRDQPIGASGPLEGPALKAAVDAELQARHGEDTTAEGEATRAGAAWLFAGKDGAQALDVLEERTLGGLAPAATVRAHVAMASYLSELALLRHEARSEPPAAVGAEPADFAAQLDAALRDEFGAATLGLRSNIDESLQHLFAGPEGETALRTITRALDSLPPMARVKAYTLSARHVAELIRLRQSQH